mmetsp:Transcript_29281/g.55513  ORF Transcript_29281/g.55513 Transcript_29281/m.55513 type:complete len:204 (-) Transcript_29281:478-1089(-)
MLVDLNILQYLAQLLPREVQVGVQHLPLHAALGVQVHHGGEGANVLFEPSHVFSFCLRHRRRIFGRAGLRSREIIFGIDAASMTFRGVRSRRRRRCSLALEAATNIVFRRRYCFFAIATIICRASDIRVNGLHYCRGRLLPVRFQIELRLPSIRSFSNAVIRIYLLSCEFHVIRLRSTRAIRGESFQGPGQRANFRLERKSTR